MRSGSQGVFLALIQFIAIVANGATNDHLVPPADDLPGSYVRLVNPKLLLTPFDCGRLVVTPALEPERSLSIYSQYAKGSRGLEYHVTYIVLSDNLWQKTDIGHQPGQARRIRAQRFNAVLPATIALDIREAWLRMLKQTRPSLLLPKEEVIRTDAAIFVYSLGVPSGAALTGEVENNLPRQGARVRNLNNLSGLLMKLCQVEKHRAASILSEIGGQTNALLELLPK